MNALPSSFVVIPRCLRVLLFHPAPLEPGEIPPGERRGHCFGKEAINAAGGAWNDDELSLRDRSVVVVTALITLGGVEDRLRGHVRWAIQHGVSPDELEAIVALLAVYIGYPRASTASDVVHDELARLGHRSSRASGSTSA